MQVASLYHPDYPEQLKIWQAIEDVCSGGRAVKKKGATYLPKLTDQEDGEYDSYKRRAVFFNATKRTREALVGMLLRKPPKITVPPEIELMTSDVDLEGSKVGNWVRMVAQQCVSTGRSVTVADWNEAEDRPYLSFYPAVNVCNWATERIDGRNELSLLILKEIAETRVGSTVEKKEQFREYALDDGVVMVKVWTAGQDSEMVSSTAEPLMRKGKALERIPAIFHNATHLGPQIGEAPLLDIADLNLHHYMGSADLENGRHICGIPTPYATGIDDDDDDLKLGSTTAWTASDPQAKFGFIEFNGTGLGELVTGQEEKEKQMAILGARLLFDNKKDAECYDTVRLRSVAETAALSNMSGYLSATLTQAIRWFIWWNGTEADPSKLDDKFGVLVNDDFVDTPMDGTTLSSFVAAFQADAISFETFFYQLEQGEVYPPEWDLEKEIAAIGQRPPATVPVPPVDPNPKPGDDPKPGDPKPNPDPKPKPAPDA